MEFSSVVNSVSVLFKGYSRVFHTPPRAGIKALADLKKDTEEYIRTQFRLGIIVCSGPNGGPKMTCPCPNLGIM